MKILINIYNLASGGGLTVGLGFVEQLAEFKKQGGFGKEEFHIVFPLKITEYDAVRALVMDTPGMEIAEVPLWYYTFIGRFFMQRKLAGLCAELLIDKVINLTNYPLKLKGKGVYQMLLIHWPYLVYEDKELWQRMTFWGRIKRKWAKRRILNAIEEPDQMVVQTEVMKIRLEKLLNEVGSGIGKDGNIRVIPAFHNFNSDPSNELHWSKPGEKMRLIFVSKFYEHKNHEILIPLAQEIMRRKLPIEIHITVHTEVGNLFEPYKKVLKNLGPQQPEHLEKLYPNYHGLFFPTLVETFGIPYIEAMHFGLPVFTSDRDFARAVCGDLANYFNPDSVEDILTVLMNPKKNISQEQVLEHLKKYRRKEIVREYLDVL